MNKYSKVWKANHIKALESLGFKASQFNRLRALENIANYNATMYCNGVMQGDEYDKRREGIESALAKLCNPLPVGFFVNGDPRGYALKIEFNHVPEGMHKDWGGYGIIAPDFS